MTDDDFTVNRSQFDSLENGDLGPTTIIGEIRCQECDAVFEKWLELLQHTNEMHQVMHDGQDPGVESAIKPGDSVENSDVKIRTTWCHICNKHLATVSSRNLHMRIHTGERPFACNVCGKAFTQNVHLRSHISVHTGAKPHVCKLCNKGFVASRTLKIHMMSHNRDQSQPYQDSDLNENEDGSEEDGPLSMVINNDQSTLNQSSEFSSLEDGVETPSNVDLCVTKVNKRKSIKRDENDGGRAKMAKRLPATSPRSRNVSSLMDGLPIIKHEAYDSMNDLDHKDKESSRKSSPIDLNTKSMTNYDENSTISAIVTSVASSNNLPSKIIHPTTTTTIQNHHQNNSILGASAVAAAPQQVPVAKVLTGTARRKATVVSRCSSTTSNAHFGGSNNNNGATKSIEYPESPLASNGIVASSSQQRSPGAAAAAQFNNFLLDYLPNNGSLNNLCSFLQPYQDFSSIADHHENGKNKSKNKNSTKNLSISTTKMSNVSPLDGTKNSPPLDNFPTTPTTKSPPNLVGTSVKQCPNCMIVDGELQLMKTEMSMIKQFLINKLSLMEQKIENLQTLMKQC